jgi:hypothetical protein
MELLNVFVMYNLEGKTNIHHASVSMDGGGEHP